MNTSHIYKKELQPVAWQLKLLHVARIVVGVLFIFSGLVKANDPAGLSYKMQEFFDVWGRVNFLHGAMIWLNEFALVFSVVTITLEILVGVALLIGWRTILISWLLLILIIFFTFLTGFAVLSGKIRTCGCFGDCIPLTALQSFIKDIVLLSLAIMIFFYRRRLRPVFTGLANFLVIVISVAIVLGFQWFVLRHMPVVDCLPFKKGSDLIKGRMMPLNAVQDKIAFHFVYSKDGKEQEFDQAHLPDSTWTFVKRDDVVLQHGSNNEPPIKDFVLNTLSGSDSTDAILQQHGNYYLFFIKDVDNSTDHWLTNFTNLYTFAKSKIRPLYVVSSQASDAQQFFNVLNKFDVPVLSCDVTAVKTAARTNPCLYLMNGSTVVQKWGWADLRKALD